jgi:hypothetical protein
MSNNHPPQPPYYPHKEEKQGGEDRPEDPHGWEIEENVLCRHRWVYPGDRPGHDVEVHSKEQADGYTYQTDDSGLNVIGLAQGPDGLLDADKEISLSEYHKGKNNQAKGRKFHSKSHGAVLVTVWTQGPMQIALGKA